MARYKKVDVRIWADENFLHLSRPGPSGQALWWRLMVPRESTNLPGLFSAGELSLAEHMGWTLKGFRKAWQEITDRKMAIADWKAGTIFLFNGIKYHEPENPNVITSWRSPWDEIPESSVKWAAYLWLRWYIENRYDKTTFLKAFDLACPEPLPRQLSVEFVASLPSRLVERLLKQYSKWFPEQLQKSLGEQIGESGAGAITGTVAESGTVSPFPNSPNPEQSTVRDEGPPNGDHTKKLIIFKNLWAPVLGKIRSYVDSRTWDQCDFESSRIVELSPEFVVVAVTERLIAQQGGPESANRRLYAMIAQANTGLMRGRGLKLISIEKLVQGGLTR